MMTIKGLSFWVLTLLISMIIGGCKEKSPQQLELNALHEEVMEVHDAVMPKMRDMYKLRKELLKMKDEANTSKLISNLEQADDAMMDWMAQYKKPGVNDEGYQQYLQKQMASITEVRDQMLSAINNAQEFLDK